MLQCLEFFKKNGTNNGLINMAYQAPTFLGCIVIL